MRWWCPVPSEIFAVLDKLGKPNWAAVLRSNKTLAKAPGEQAETALLLGTVIAEGFIAVEATKTTEVKEIGKNVLKLAKALGVGKEVTERTNAILNYADKADWPGVRKELDLALSDVKRAMVKLDSEPLSQLVSLGGWLRGTEALTTVVTTGYTKDGAELLHQPLCSTTSISGSPTCGPSSKTTRRGEGAKGADRNPSADGPRRRHGDLREDGQRNPRHRGGLGENHRRKGQLTHDSINAGSSFVKPFVRFSASPCCSRSPRRPRVRPSTTRSPSPSKPPSPT